MEKGETQRWGLHIFCTLPSVMSENSQENLSCAGSESQQASGQPLLLGMQPLKESSQRKPSEHCQDIDGNNQATDT